MRPLKFTFQFALRNSGLATLLCGAFSCTVYAPMQPIMPLVAGPNQAEASASLQPNGRVEGTVAYSPAMHVLLTAGGSVCPKLGTNNFLVTRQYEFGAGGYLPLGRKWLLNGLGGYGQAVNTRGYTDLAFIYGSTYSEYHARYDKLFAQMGIANVQARHSMGFTFRLTRVHFALLTDSQLGGLPLSNMLRHEALFFFRHALGQSGRWEAQTSIGLSASSTREQDDSQDFSDISAAAHQANRNLRPALYASLGAVYHPHWGGR
ncbi:MAG: hypothetical protein JWR44_2091 [Hymenobacter sp.]|jgi:hypothetical protein|nr:hypothetical protein [Hymenobacter sp.]